MVNLRKYVIGVNTQVPTNGVKQRYINLDNAASTPPFESVLAAVDEFVPWYSSVHRGNGFKSRFSTELYEEARRIVGRFFGANPDEYVVIFGKNTTEAINKLSYRLQLKKNDIVLISHLEHHSNDLPWRARATVKRIGLTPEGGVDQAHFSSLLEQYAGRIRLVAISGASNVTGHIPDIDWFARKAHEAGAQILVDCAQLAARRSIRVGSLQDKGHLDYIAISGHKMYAPFGAGALIARRDIFARGEPEYKGGGTIMLVTPSIIDWAAAPDSEEAGSPNVVGVVALARAIKILEHIGMNTIAGHEAALTRYALTRLKEVPDLVVYGEVEPSYITDRAGVISFAIGKMPAHLVAAILGYEWSIGVRSGCFCAQSYIMALLGLDRSAQRRIRYNVLHQRHDLVPGMVRISFGLYNTQDEIDVLIKALTAISRGQHDKYTVDKATGYYTPLNTTEDFSAIFNI